MPRSIPFLALLTLLCALPGATLAQQEPAYDSAMFLLRQAVVPARDGRHNLMLRALRHLRDPELSPLYNKLAEHEHPVLKIHGLLGQAEATGKVDLARLAAMKDSEVAWQAVMTLIDADLLSAEDARQLLTWEGLDRSVRLIVALSLARHGDVAVAPWLEQAVGSENPLERGLASLLLVQAGDGRGLEYLETFSQSDHAQRDAVRMTLLLTAMKHRLDRTGGWALSVAQQPGVPLKLEMMALQAAIRFGLPEAAGLWQQRFESQTDVARRTQWAMLALQLARQMPPAAMTPMVESGDRHIATIGRAAQAVAQGQRELEAVTQLLNTQHAPSIDWALDYAREQAEPAVAQRVLAGVLGAYQASPRHRTARRLEQLVIAAEALAESHGREGLARLRARLEDPDTEPALSQAILLGLIRAHGKDLHLALPKVAALPSLEHRGLAMFVLARHSDALGKDQLDQLGVLVRGGGSYPQTVRLQAGWLYLKKTGQAQRALSQALENLP